jgi:hypothetical protein
MENGGSLVAQRTGRGEQNEQKTSSALGSSQRPSIFATTKSVWLRPNHRQGVDKSTNNPPRLEVQLMQSCQLFVRSHRSGCPKRHYTIAKIPDLCGQNAIEEKHLGHFEILTVP